jgi:hypothetical protein
MEANMTTATPDIFTNVHKGIRLALFEACKALGRAGTDTERADSARAQLRAVIHFVEHHGDNEDQLLVPMLDPHAPEVAKRILAAHAPIQAALRTLAASIDVAPMHGLYLQVCQFLGVYLEHMYEEEHELEPAIRAALSSDELATFGRRVVERTTPGDQRMMLGWMLPAMTRADIDVFLARLPPELAEQLRPLAG